MFLFNDTLLCELLAVPTIVLWIENLLLLEGKISIAVIIGI